MGQCHPRLHLGLKKAMKARRTKAKRSKSVGGVDMNQFSSNPMPIKPDSPGLPVPTLADKSWILRDEDVEFLSANSPHWESTLYSDEPVKWRRLYSLKGDGRSFQWLRHAVLAEGPTLVVIETEDGHVFGGYTDTWGQISDCYYGMGSSCAVFKLRPDEPAVFPPTYQNSNFQYLNLAYEKLGCIGGIAMGGQHGFYAWRVDQEMWSGECCGNPNSTFGSPLLCQSEAPAGRDSATFRLKNMEIWLIGEPPMDSNSVHLRTAKAENTISILELFKEQFGNITGKAFFSDNLSPPVRPRGPVAEPTEEEIAKEIEEKIKELQEKELKTTELAKESEKDQDKDKDKEKSKRKTHKKARRHHHHHHHHRKSTCSQQNDGIELNVISTPNPTEGCAAAGSQ